jgi:hypothetical protein
MKKLILLFISGVYFNLSAQDKIKIYADYDAAIGYHDHYNTSSNNYGNAIQNAAYTLPGNQGGLNENRALIHFDLNNVPKNKKIKSIKLNLFALGNSNNGLYHRGSQNSTYITRVTENWSEKTVTWDNQPKSTLDNKVVLSNSTSKNQDYINIDVTQLFTDIISNDNNGIKLSLADEKLENALFFASLNCGDSTKFPFIELEFEKEICLLKNSDFDAAIGYNVGYNTEKNNYGNALQNAAYVLNNNYGDSNVNRALIHFDLSFLPKNCLIKSASLNLYALISNGIPNHSGDNAAYIERVIEPWKEYSVTWNNQPNTSIENRVELPKSTSPTQNYLNIDVRKLIVDIVKNENYGLLLKLQKELKGNALFFASNNFSDSTKRPTLDVCFEEIDTIKIDTVSIAKINILNNFSVNLFPNPVNQLLKVELVEPFNDLSYDIIDISGMTVQKQSGIKSKSFEIDFTNYNSGTYFFRFYSSTDSILYSKKIIVNH